MFNLKKKFKNKNFNFNFFDLDKQWQCIHEKHFEFYFIKILRMQSIDFKILNVGYKGKVSISRAIEIINNRLPSRNKIFLRGKSTTTELNLNRLMKITKKKFYTLKDGVNLLLR